MFIRPVIESTGHILIHVHLDGTPCQTDKPAILAPCGAFEVLWTPIPCSAWSVPERAWVEGRDVVPEDISMSSEKSLDTDQTM